MVLAKEGARKLKEADALTWLLTKIDSEGRPGTIVEINTSLNVKVSISRNNSVQSPGTNEAVLGLVNDFVEDGSGAIDRLETHA